MRNLGLWNPGYSSRESGNPLTIGSRNPCSTERKLALFRTKDNVLLILLPPAPAQLIYFFFPISLFFFYFYLPFRPHRPHTELLFQHSVANSRAMYHHHHHHHHISIVSLLLLPLIFIVSLILMHVLFAVAVIVKVPVHFFRRANRA